MTSTVATGTYLATLVAFFKVHQIASKASVDAVRTVLLGNRQPFPDAEEVSESSRKEEPAETTEIPPSADDEIKIHEIV
jgi:hypothetical protein